MSKKNSFLTQHPKIVKKIMGSSGITTPRQTPASSFYGGEQGDSEDMTAQILNKQSQINEALSLKIRQIHNKNDLLEQSLKYFDMNQEENKLLSQIDQAKKEQSALMGRIQNCEKVQKSTTTEEYYLWQKKKKTDLYNNQLEQLHMGQKEERQRMKNVCINYGKAIDKCKQEIESLVLEIDRYQNGEGLQSSSKNYDTNEEFLTSLKNQYEELKSTVGLMKESNSISKDQFYDTAENIEDELNMAFDNYRSSLIKDILKIKLEISQSAPEPPIKQQTASVANAITEYENTIKEIKQSLDDKMIDQSNGLFEPYNWKNVDWKSYLDEVEKEQQPNYQEQFLLKQKQLEIIVKQIEKLERECQNLISQIVDSQQKNNELEQSLSRAYRATLSMIK